MNAKEFGFVAAATVVGVVVVDGVVLGFKYAYNTWGPKPEKKPVANPTVKKKKVTKTVA
jgi:hypothetical protein